MEGGTSRTLFFVAEKQTGPKKKCDYEIIGARNVNTPQEIIAALEANQQKNAQQLLIPVLTDPFEYKGKDQVIPLQPEQVFFMDYTHAADIHQANILEVGLGSGILSIFCLMKGAAHCTGLEINPRAKIFTGYNTLFNDLDARLEIKDGNVTDIFAPVEGRKFNFIYSNPPFEPTPPGMDYYFNSAAGIYGLTFVEELLKNVDQHLEDNGVFQMVTMAPGNEQEAFMLQELAEKYLPGTAAEIILDLQPITYAAFVDRFVSIFGEEEEKIQQMKTQADKDGVTHLHMLVFKYRKGMKGNVQTVRTHKTYETWSSPLGTANTLYSSIAS
ncbi:methyltransferase [Chitinophaga nivalis]|uniref:Methyltransferase n=1 Tax=Chitinophaga nivalis TaxID=2991709 RepID=A0ABT3IJ29_9BACT|nr:methyltransferase [Chitinophaga nivalis]MCW3466351.1 methyltransferase [Chitinophaga nivalis]MCW3483958.1 methyltransferase [Chitinophaga nivalis]